MAQFSPKTNEIGLQKSSFDQLASLFDVQCDDSYCGRSSDTLFKRYVQILIDFGDSCNT